MKLRKAIALSPAIMILVAASVAGTIAWLQDKTQDVKNTFTTSMVDITLVETDSDDDTDADNNSYKMVPGAKIDKDPVVTIKNGSEPCWVFIKVEKSANYDDFMAYAIDEEYWTELTAETGVYYHKADTIAADIPLNVLAAGSYTDGMGTDGVDTDDVIVAWGDKQVAVKPSVTNEQMAALDAADYPTLTFTAYAIQQEGFTTAAAAWAEAQNATQFSATP